MRITVQDIQKMKTRGEKIAMLTAYDYSIARLLDEAEVPVLLVGDSLGTVVLGHETTIPVTMEDVLRHSQAVVRGARRALIVADMPFMSYQISPQEALRNAGRLVQEGGAQAVKLEGGTTIAGTVRRIVDCGIPVMGHIGLTPQSVHQLGGYKTQGRTEEVASRLLEDAEAIERAGAFSIVFECMPAPLAKILTSQLKIPTVGIGAGPHCDGQIQVLYDLLGLFNDFVPRHTRRYADIGSTIRQAAREYRADVADRSFPAAEESFTMDERVLQELQTRCGILTES